MVTLCGTWSAKMLIQGKLTVTRDAILRQFLEKSVGIIKACTPALPSTKRWPNGVVLSTLCPPSWLSWLLNTSVTGTVTYFLSCCPIGQCIGVQMLHTGCSHIWLGTLNFKLRWSLCLGSSWTRDTGGIQVWITCGGYETSSHSSNHDQQACI